MYAKLCLPLLICYFQIYSQTINADQCQDCLLANNGDRPLPMLLRPANGNRFKPNPVQAIITSYKFNCSGVITEWRALVEGSSIGAFEEQIYTISFQVWRPNSLSPVDTDGCYNLAGFNHFSPIPLAHPDTTERGIVTGVPLESERIEVQPGDVVGFYLEGSRTSLDSIQFAGDEDNPSPYIDETVWFATDLLTPRPETACMYPVGTSGLLNSSTNLAPLISVAISTKTVVSPSSSYTITTLSHRMLTPTPTPIHTLSTSQPVVTTDTNPTRVTENTVYALIVLLVVLIVVLLIGATLFTIRWVRKATSRSVPENQEMKIDPTTDENEAYGQLREATSPDNHSYDYMDETDMTIAATQNPAYLTTVSDDVQYYENEGKPEELGMTANEAYAVTRETVTDVEDADKYDYVV